jgi:hypothetical protein
VITLSKWDNVITWEQWEETYKPVTAPSTNDVMFDYGNEEHVTILKTYSENQMWTVINGEGSYLDEGELVSYIDIIPGTHWVNRFAYCVTEIPWTDEQLYVTNSPDDHE